MAESISRVLRDGALEGEYAPALTIEDSISSPFGVHVFIHLLAQLSSNILAGKSQPRGVVVVAFSRSPSFYVDLLKRRGSDTASAQKWIRILDCYTDPLGWTDQIVDSASTRDISQEASSAVACLCKDVWDMDKLYSSIIEQGTGLSKPGIERFSVAIDSVDELLRHASTSSVAGLLNNLRSHDQVSSVFWLLHSDIHEDKVASIFEYMSSMVASIEPLNQSANWKRGNLESFSLLKQNFGKGRLNVRFKRRNGRVRVLLEEFHIEQERISFTSVSSGDGVVNQSLVSKVQFNLQLSEKERIERENVVLPFEHQGNGKTIEIYDGRRSLTENLKEVAPTLNEKFQTSNNTGEGEIIYFRDSDDEMPDSDEDPDDDLDI